jgi:hypothetical protein
MKVKNIIAIVCSDIHLSDKPPLSRSIEPDWYEAMARPLTQLDEYAKLYKVPIICAGDIFDRWNSPPELINFALQYIPEGMYCIPGQHDLPHHAYADIEKSAYWTLVKAGRINNIQAKRTLPRGVTFQPANPIGKHLVLWGFPWGFPVEPINRVLDIHNVAVVHSYIWTSGHGYKGAPKEKYCSKYFSRLKGCNTAIWGDNHSNFSATNDNTNIYNCGCLIPRKSDEKKQPPTIGLLKKDGSVQRVFLEHSEDKWLNEKELTKILSSVIDLDGLIDDFRKLTSEKIDFVDLLRQVMRKTEIGKRTKEILKELLEETYDK